jgi:hypothetical protein
VSHMTVGVARPLRELDWRGPRDYQACALVLSRESTGTLRLASRGSASKGARPRTCPRPQPHTKIYDSVVYVACLAFLRHNVPRKRAPHTFESDASI